MEATDGLERRYVAISEVRRPQDNHKNNNNNDVRSRAYSNTVCRYEGIKRKGKVRQGPQGLMMKAKKSCGRNNNNNNNRVC